MVQLTQRLSMQLKQSPQQVLLSSLLQLPVLSLEQRIRMELETNPLLEMELEEELEQEQEMELKAESNENDENDSQDKQDEIDWEEILHDQDSYEIHIPREKNPDVFERPEVFQETLTDHLLSQLNMTQMTPHEILIGEYIIWNINGVGYLSMDADTIAENLEEDVENVEKVLAVIQRFEPTGIAARNLQECLLIQLLEEENPNELAITFVRDHFDDFKNKRFEKLAKNLDISLETVKEVIEHITKLNPKPGEGFIAYENNYVVPDLEVKSEDGEFKVYMHDWNIPHLRINNEYRKMMLDRKKTNKETRDYIKQRLESARRLLNSAALPYQQAVSRWLSQLLRGDTRPRFFEIKGVKKDGVQFDIELVSFPTTYEGQPAIQTHIRDITHKKHLEEHLSRTEKLAALGS